MTVTPFLHIFLLNYWQCQTQYLKLIKVNNENASKTGLRLSPAETEKNKQIYDVGLYIEL